MLDLPIEPLCRPEPAGQDIPAAAAAVCGRLDLALVNDGATRISRLVQHQPLRVLFPRADAGVELSAVMANTAGGVVGGDYHRIRVSCGPGSTALITGQAAEKIYRSRGAVSQIEVALEAGPHSWLEWLPQGTILFDSCRLRRMTCLSLDRRSRVMAGEILLFGRAAMGESLHEGLIRDGWRVRIDGRLRWADTLHLAGEMQPVLTAAGGFHGARAMATFLYAAANAASLLAPARAALEELGDGAAGLRVGGTAFEGLLVARWLGADPAAVRRHFGRFWARFRALAGRRPASLPTIWRI